MTERRKTTPELIRAFQQGRNREESFNGLWELYVGPVYRYFEKKKMPPDRCWDLTQEVFLTIYHRLDHLRAADKFENWLYTIASHRYKRELQRSSKWRPASEQGAEAVADSRYGPEESLLEQEQQERFRRACQALPEQQRLCLELRYGDDLSYREIAERLAIGVETVKTHLHQARKALRVQFGPDIIEGGEDG